MHDSEAARRPGGGPGSRSESLRHAARPACSARRPGCGMTRTRTATRDWLTGSLSPCRRRTQSDSEPQAQPRCPCTVRVTCRTSIRVSKARFASLALAVRIRVGAGPPRPKELELDPAAAADESGPARPPRSRGRGRGVSSFRGKAAHWHHCTVITIVPGASHGHSAAPRQLNLRMPRPGPPRLTVPAAASGGGPGWLPGRVGCRRDRNSEQSHLEPWYPMISHTISHYRSQSMISYMISRHYDVIVI